MASLLSHLAAGWLGILTEPQLIERTGSDKASRSLCALGSSLLGFGLDWTQIAQTTQRRIEHCSVPAASPAELAEIESKATPTDLHVIGISIFEMNERYLSDFRSMTVPLAQTVQDLRASNSSWMYTKRVLGQYPLTYIRKVFPTAGRSLGVMVGLREKLRTLKGQTKTADGDAPAFGPHTEYTESISTWDPARMIRKLSELRVGMQGAHSFDGPKQLALRRLLNQSLAQGRTIVVVLPVSPPYLKQLISSSQIAEFEASVSKLTSEFPDAAWVRADQIAALQSPEYYWDLIHLNVAGRTIATEYFLNQFTKLGRHP